MKPLEKIKQLNGRQKIEFIIASALTAAFMIALPVYAWFSSNRNLETITKIKEPGEIIIRAGKRTDQTEADPIVNFEMKDLDIEAIISDNKPQQFVFSVLPGDYNLGYDIQLAHTTNIPFTYTLYKATMPSTAGKTPAEIETLVDAGTWTVYSPRNNKADKTYYQKDGDALTMNTLNADNRAYGRVIAKQDDTDDSHKSYSQTYDEGDNPEIYAVPIYMQTVTPINHSSDSKDDYDYFILELSWDTSAVTTDGYPFADWNAGKNNKETDMIYITASRHLG